MRQPAVADRFYPGSPNCALPDDRKAFCRQTIPAGKTKALAVVCPHAGYIYSGELAAKTFTSVEIPKTVIILGPNHHRPGSAGLSFDGYLGHAVRQSSG